MTFRRNLLPTAIGISLLVLALDFLLPFAPNWSWFHEGVLVVLILSLSGIALAQLRRLGDAERRLERASLSSLEGHWELDYLKGTRWHSSSFETLLGYEPRERFDTLGEAGIATHPDDRLIATQTLRDHIAKGVPLDFVVRLAMADGSYRWFRMRGGVVGRDAHGGPARVCGAAQDVHDQKLAEDQLRQVRARFERAVHGTQDGLWEIDLSGPRGRFWLSPRLNELLGFGDGELGDGEDVVRERIHPDDRTLSDEALRRQLADGTPIDTELRVLTRGGEYRWFRVRGSPGFDASGRVIRTSGSMQDVTEARAAREALLQAKEAAQAASRAKTAFLATMSHEIRTPMNGIIGMTALLSETVLGRVQREYLEAIRMSSNSLLAVINDVLDFSKIEAGKLEVESLEMDLRANVEEVGAMMALQAALKDLELIVDVRPDVPQWVLGDPQRIRQCLVNLVSNAIKFTVQGEIVIEVRLAEAREGLTRVRFEVRDTGIGIAPEARAELFQPFTQADSSTTRKFGGTGLGLSIVKRLVELMGGEVTVASVPGKGSIFGFTLPLKPCEAAAREEPPHADGAGRRVLVVDDNETNRRVVAGHLAYANFDAAQAASAAEALALMRRAVAESRPYEAVFVDYQMPEVDGAMLGERVKGEPALARSRLVLLTSLDRQGDHAKFASMGFAAYLTKPVRPRELRECLEHVLAHDAEEWSTGTHPLVTRATLASTGTERQYGGRVLVVEDNLVNQKVAQRFLERLGCSVRVASDGSEAVAVCAAERFDLILMDMQMPVMDGVSATRAIRARETEDSRTPIVALTANVLSGQFQSCLDAGMDDVLAKPLEPARLKDVLERFVLRASAGGPVSAGRGAAAATRGVSDPSLEAPPLDLARLGSLAADDPVFMHELVSAFRASAAGALEEMRGAAGSGDRERLRRAAHKLKGASENIGAGRLRDLARELETSAPQAVPADRARSVEAIAAELEEVDAFFSAVDIAALAQRRA